MSLYHLCMMALCGAAWRIALPHTPARVNTVYLWLRPIRDSLSSLVPMGGEFVAIRVLGRYGVPAASASASLVVDTAVEIASQAAFTILGLALLLLTSLDSELAAWSALGLAVMIPLCGALAAAGYLILPLLTQLAHRAAKAKPWRSWTFAGDLHSSIRAICENRRGIFKAFILHLLGWILGVGEAWIALKLMGAPFNVLSLLIIESLTFALRSAAFVVPGALGVQEASYVLLGSAFGLSGEIMLAFSLLKRARELLLGAISLAIWQGMEGQSIWKQRRTAKAVPAVTPVTISRPFPAQDRRS